MKYLTTATTIALCFMTTLSPILDGTVNPIIIENSYTFTNFEWAKGFVQFKNGFSVASTNTVILDVNYPIQGVIDVNNGGTIIMNGDLHLGNNATINGAGSNGTGYIKTNGHELILSNNLFTLFKPLHFFGGDVTINGRGVTILQMVNFTGALNFKQVTNVTFKNITLFINNPSIRLLFPSTNLNTLNFYNTDIIFFASSALTVGANNVLVGGNCSFAGRGASITVPTTFQLDSTGNFELKDFSTLAVNALNIGSVESVFTLNNQTSLQFTQTPTSSIIGDGRFLIRGNAFFKSNNTIVSMNNNQDLLIDSGGRLTLDNIQLNIA